MYDFSKQKAMLEATLLLLRENNLVDISALGGGTALSSYYWNHRYSTDIDIFIYDRDDKKHLLKDTNWSERVKASMENIGYSGNFINHPIYSEISIDKDSKIQFFDVIKKSKIPYKKVTLWENNILIETIEEIIAKKIYYRADKGNTRDLFDIAVALHKEPDIFTRTRLKKDKIIALFETVSNINDKEELKSLYLEEIKQMNPNSEYSFLATNTIEYLFLLLENICGAFDMGYELSSEEYKEIEEYTYTSLEK
ncbi:nucleotidyl transferase AbiEii/AbiGii toxin family protein [Halarcobacter sp.]|uniref:nucleotidyl transferase AbiEii/AbiGii toxin family protein n=1 Tax=Halarcobacter sp. TaxID=2321133 RepID=UPI0029F573F1|nr:nucleotidyl transferase AbiEii/AbiGii toxin family protein [Halarcobacter sp.]